MLQPLPAETVFEAKRKSRRDTFVLFSLLISVYVLIFNLMGLSILFGDSEMHPRTEDMPSVIFGLSLLAFFTAWLHFIWARSRPVAHLMKAFGAAPAAETDEVHKRFLNIVDEARIASGIGSVRAVVVPDMSLNAFSIEDGRGEKVIGATEGLLAKLSRSELEAVIAHEAAHLAHGDSRVVMTACSLFAVFLIMSRVLRPRRSTSRGRGGGGMAVLWLLSLIGYFFARVLAMGISRTREYLADSHAAHMCKDPLALSNALEKISTGNRGGMHIPDGFSPVFIMNPRYAYLDEQDGMAADLFSTHPPVAKRIERLQKWAHQEMPSPKGSASTGIYVRSEEDGKWNGPVEPAQAVQQNLVQPTSWVAESSDLKQASHQSVLYHGFVDQVPNKTSHICPRCEVPLGEAQYEGMPVLECHFCKGKVLYPGGIEKAISRRFERFADAKKSEALAWRTLQKGTVKELCAQPHVKCPLCSQPMFKSVHTELTRVVIDRCLKPDCGAVWCDGGEIEMIQMLIEAQPSPS